MSLSVDQVNQQAASIAASVLNDSVIAAARCEQITQTMQLEAAGIGGATRGMAKFGSKLGRSMMPSVGKMAEGLRGGGLPDSFLLAVTTSHVHALEEKEKKGKLVPGAILRSWDREGFLASRGSHATSAMSVVPEDRQVLVLYLPLDGAQSKYLAAAARQMAAAGSPGKPTKFLIAKDAPSEAVLDELVRNSPVPTVQAAGIGAQAAPPVAADSTAQLAVLAQLQASGALTDAEYEAQKKRIIDGG